MPSELLHNFMIAISEQVMFVITLCSLFDNIRDSFFSTLYWSFEASTTLYEAKKKDWTTTLQKDLKWFCSWRKSSSAWWSENIYIYCQGATCDRNNLWLSYWYGASGIVASHTTSHTGGRLPGRKCTENRGRTPTKFFLYIYKAIISIFLNSGASRKLAGKYLCFFCPAHWEMWLTVLFRGFFPLN
jgi:hypothetical protein